MTISIDGLVGEFGYPPQVVGHLIKQFWTPASVGETNPPTFRIPITDSKTKDPWFEGNAPEIVFRHNDTNNDIEISIGDGLFKCEYGIAIHLFCTTKLQEFRYQKHINDLIKEHRRRPILKYYDSNNNSGLNILTPTGIRWHSAPDSKPEDVQEITNTHSVGFITARWYEHRT
jgi:hypothetical protein